MAGDEAFHTRKPRSLENLLIRSVRLAERDIVAEFSEEKVGILHGKADAGTQIGGIVLPGIDPVDENATVLGLVKAKEQASHRRLARSDPTDDAYLFTT